MNLNIRQVDTALGTNRIEFTDFLGNKIIIQESAILSNPKLHIAIDETITDEKVIVLDIPTLKALLPFLINFAKNHDFFPYSTMVKELDN